jgi:hypothetical protein
MQMNNSDIFAGIVWVAEELERFHGLPPAAVEAVSVLFVSQALSPSGEKNLATFFDRAAAVVSGDMPLSWGVCAVQAMETYAFAWRWDSRISCGGSGQLANRDEWRGVALDIVRSGADPVALALAAYMVFCLGVEIDSPFLSPRALKCNGLGEAVPPCLLVARGNTWRKAVRVLRRLWRKNNGGKK